MANDKLVPTKFDEDDEFSCLINTRSLWTATEIIGELAEGIRTQRFESIDFVEASVRSATRGVKEFEGIAGGDLDEILVELDDIADQAAQNGIFTEAERPEQPGRVATDPEVLESLRRRLSDIHDKMLIRGSVELVNCLIGD